MTDDAQLKVDLYIDTDTDTEISSFTYGRDGMFIGLDFKINDVVYNMYFADATKIEEVFKAPS